MQAKAILFWAAVVLVLAHAVPAGAGDYAAHSAATTQAVAVVAAEPEFKDGLGSPRFRVFDDSHGKGHEKEDAVNHPDDWACFDERQPPELTELHSKLGILTTFFTQELGTFGDCPLAMACNYTHFAQNPVGLPTTADGHRITRLWADEIVANIEKTGRGLYVPGSLRFCNGEGWLTYWRRVLASLHYIQDNESEHHVDGNSVCDQRELIARFADTGSVFDFGEVFKCDQWLSDRLAQMLAPSWSQCEKTLACDGAVYGKDQFKCDTASMTTRVIAAACFDGIRAACMGLERLIRHHCNMKPGKSFICAGPEADNCSDCVAPDKCGHRYGYCEGEVCPSCDAATCPGQGGENFVFKAKKVSVPILEDAARAWARVCKEPLVCTPKECDLWCVKSKPASLGMVARGDCTGEGRDCTCVCSETVISDMRSPASCGERREPPDAGAGAPDAGPACPPEALPNGSCQWGSLFCKGNKGIAPCNPSSGEKCCPADMCNYAGACVMIKCPPGGGLDYNCKCGCTGAALDPCNQDRVLSCPGGTDAGISGSR